MILMYLSDAWIRSSYSLKSVSFWSIIYKILIGSELHMIRYGQRTNFVFLELCVVDQDCEFLI